MKKLPNEGSLSLENIRQLEFGELIDLKSFDIESFIIYDKDFRISKNSTPQDISFAFIKK